MPERVRRKYEKALADVTAAEANASKLDAVWAEIRPMLPSDLAGVSDPQRYDERIRVLRDIVRQMPAIDGAQLDFVLPGSEEILSQATQLAGTGMPEATSHFRKALFRQGEVLADYKHRLVRKRQEVARLNLKSLCSRVDRLLRSFAKEAASLQPNEQLPDERLNKLREAFALISQLLDGKRLPRWGDLSRHLGFGLKCDLDDIIRLDWPPAREEIGKFLYADDEPTPIEAKDLGAAPARGISGRYERRSEIGSGGFGRVFRAVRRADGVEVALKELSGAVSPEDIERFKREVKLQSMLLHPNIVPILEADTASDPPFCVIPLAQWNLKDSIPKLVGDLARTKRLFDHVLRGVEHAHRKGVIHRDLKPENVLIFWDDDQETARVADFGLGKRLDSESLSLTSTNRSMGTPLYAAPEQWDDSKNVDERADIFGLGRMLQEMIVGRLTLYSTAADVPASTGLADVIRQCTERDPEARYATIASLRADLGLSSESRRA